MEWCIFVQCTMNSAFIIVGGEFDEDLTQVGFSEHDVGALFDLVEVRQLHGWHVLDAEQLRRCYAAVTGDDLPLVVDEDRIAKAKSLDALGDLADLLLGVCSRIARVRSKRSDRAALDLHISSFPRGAGPLGVSASSCVAILAHGRMDRRLRNPKMQGCLVVSTSVLAGDPITSRELA